MGRRQREERASERRAGLYGEGRVITPRACTRCTGNNSALTIPSCIEEYGNERGERRRFLPLRRCESATLISPLSAINENSDLFPWNHGYCTYNPFVPILEEDNDKREASREAIP